MKVFRNIKKNKNIAIALGYFDGVHIGHRKIIKNLIRLSKENNLKSAVVTFEKNPANYFNQNLIPDIQTYKDKEIILEALGVDYVYELDFEEYKNISAFDYLKNILIENFDPKFIVVGYNHTFGKDKTGTVQFLKDMEINYNYKAIIVPEEKYKDEIEVSSTSIRQLIQEGELEKVKPLLGRYFSLRNLVIKGDKLARVLGYPTANTLWPNTLVKLPHGVYFGFAQVDSKVIPALISWGNKPTLSDGKNEMLEAHIYNFSENIYGKIIKIIFVQKLRDQENFGNIRVLKTRLQKDYKHFEAWARVMSYS